MTAYKALEKHFQESLTTQNHFSLHFQNEVKKEAEVPQIQIQEAVQLQEGQEEPEIKKKETFRKKKGKKVKGKGMKKPEKEEEVAKEQLEV
mmetsp:Transcript_22685/g.21867  ORF Transcript_22685/g.21867 Transcript_22685/m.21867 type:complete len:91 (+) Transcript_22685:41-313(+)